MCVCQIYPFLPSKTPWPTCGCLAAVAQEVQRPCNYERTSFSRVFYGYCAAGGYGGELSWTLIASLLIPCNPGEFFGYLCFYWRCAWLLIRSRLFFLPSISHVQVRIATFAPISEQGLWDFRYSVEPLDVTPSDVLWILLRCARRSKQGVFPVGIAVVRRLALHVSWTDYHHHFCYFIEGSIRRFGGVFAR